MIALGAVLRIDCSGNRRKGTHDKAVGGNPDERERAEHEPWGRGCEVGRLWI